MERVERFGARQDRRKLRGPFFALKCIRAAVKEQITARLVREW